MYPFLESIRLENQQLHFMEWHEARFLHTQRANWGSIKYKNLDNIIKTHPDFPKDDQKYKCRLVYSPKALTITFTAYTPRVIRRLQPVQINKIDYTYKSTDRHAFNLLTNGLATDTEILIFKNGLLTDSSFSNLALYDGHNWYTPEVPLFQGVHRSYLLQKSILQKTEITQVQLKNYQKIRLINAMMDWEDTWELPITAVKE